MAAPDPAGGGERNPGQDLAAEALDQRRALAGGTRQCRGERRTTRRWQGGEDLSDQREAGADFVDTDEYAAVHVAFDQHGNDELERIVRRIRGTAPRVEAAPGGATDRPAGGEAVHQLERRNPGRHGAIEQ